MHAEWSIRVFPWTVDPRKDLAGWRREARGARSRLASSRSLDLVYGQGGPSQVGLSPAIDKANLPRDRFGTVASCKVALDEGEWRISTLSDDGVRVTADGKTIIDNWTWHGPTRNTAVLTLPSRRTVQFLVEHFELDGHAVLTLEIEQISSK